jgi:hypothetical protein
MTNKSYTSKIYTDSAEAYKLMNAWTRIKTNYEIQFQGKEVTEVEILFDKNIPKFATVHYESNNCIGFESIDLSKKMLLEKPQKTLELRL